MIKLIVSLVILIAVAVIPVLDNKNKFRLEMQLKDSYVFDGKKRDPNTTWEIASNQINENYVGNLLMTAFLNVKQYRTFSFGGGLNRPPSDLKGDAKEKKAVKYVDKEIKKGLYVQRIKKVAQSLNDEIYSVFNSIDDDLSRSHSCRGHLWISVVVITWHYL